MFSSASYANHVESVLGSHMCFARCETHLKEALNTLNSCTTDEEMFAGNIVGGGRFSFVLGDIHDTFDETVAKTGLPDMLFLDSAHSRDMAVWYTDHMFPQFGGKHTYVSVHEVHNPTFWNDPDLNANKARDMEKHPDWMATEEGLTITDWLLYQPYACGVHSMAMSRWPGVYKAMNDVRAQVMGYDLRNGGLRQHIQENPTLFFELNCPQLCPGVLR